MMYMDTFSHMGTFDHMNTFELTTSVLSNTSMSFCAIFPQYWAISRKCLTVERNGQNLVLWGVFGMHMGASDLKHATLEIGLMSFGALLKKFGHN